MMVIASVITVEFGENVLPCCRIHVSFLGVHALDEFGHAHLVMPFIVGQLISDLDWHEGA